MPSFKLAMLFIVYLLVTNFSYCYSFDVTVSLDGTGNYVKISDAIAAAPNLSTKRFSIHVKPGTYKELIEVPPSKTFIALIGDDASTTIIVDDRSNGTGSTTATSATLTVRGANFMAQSLTFQNSAGPKEHQAVAVLDQAKHSAYYKCVFLGYQDTLYAGGLPQFFRECDIYGSIDFIFGNGVTVFQDCNIYVREFGIKTTVTAQSKANIDDQSGFVFQNCKVTVSPEIASSKDKVLLYLGRPWKEYSTVVFIESFLDTVVQPKGWLGWPDVPVDQLFFAEYNNTGPGADTSRRVDWPGYHILHTATQVTRFTVENFIGGSQWLPETGIPFRTGF
ncbi:pectinesterase-like [Cucurbita moschata]|uniref:Pectinesterase n=2 Tax=Cucurbita TaxID=3660 RepID=A0A6J1G4B3_CUCMO